MKAIIAGGRTFTDRNVILDAMALSHFPIKEVVSGKCSGVDTVAVAIAKWYGTPVKEFPADWDKHGKKAGPIRNQEMAEYADALIAIWDGKSRGTGNMIHCARKQGLKVYIHSI